MKTFTENLRAALIAAAAPLSIFHRLGWLIPASRANSAPVRPAAVRRAVTAARIADRSAAGIDGGREAGAVLMRAV